MSNSKSLKIVTTVTDLVMQRIHGQLAIYLVKFSMIVLKTIIYGQLHCGQDVHLKFLL